MKIFLIFSRILRYLSEHLPKWKETAKRNILFSFHEVKKRGKEHLTVMFIPHSEKKILTFHISHFTISFVTVLIMVAIIFALLSLLSHTTTQQEVANLIEGKKEWAFKEKLIQKEIEDLNENLEGIKPQIEQLYVIASSTKGESIDLWAKGGISEEIFSTENFKDGNLPTDVYDLKQARYDLKLTQKYIEHIKHFLEEREKVFSKIPSIWPLKVGGYITSDYGWRKHPFRRRKMERHRGIDIASWPGAPIIATADGTVAYAGWRGGYGLTVIIRHAYGFESHYAHLSRIRAYTGRKIKRGQVIGYMGRSGLTTGYHLHYEIRIGIADVNPWPYIMNIK
ncbi:MAG: M23 family metallopeptidase [Spirochaetes bacterium]|nr:M23 family metallopeptidase [Spirochaetota bacterium]